MDVITDANVAKNILYIIVGLSTSVNISYQFLIHSRLDIDSLLFGGLAVAAALIIRYSKKPKSLISIVAKTIAIFSLICGILFFGKFYWLLIAAILIYAMAVIAALIGSKKQLAVGKIYFDYDCDICSEVRDWFLHRSTTNLKILSASAYEGVAIKQVTYIDHKEQNYRSVDAIASALKHINLGYAALGLCMRFPLINFVLQMIINSMDLGVRTGKCTLDSMQNQ